MLFDAFIAPFLEFAFMRRALVAALALALGCAPVGVFLILRRMSLIGDAMSHAILPGAAIGYLLAGLSIPAMALGGVAAGLLTAIAAVFASRLTVLREDATFAAFYLISLAAGVLIVSMHGSNIDLMHVLFGSVLGVDDTALIIVAAIATVSMATIAVLFRPLVVECFDPEFLRAVGGPSARIHAVFVVLVVVNLVASFQALGTLMAVGLMMLPAAAARFWTRGVAPLIALAVALALASGYLGLVLSFAFDLPSGPAIVLTAGAIYVASLLGGLEGGLASRLVPRRHLEA
ncbi:MAG: metal ABC transporter permease [Alphaproteobacteria bacterium]|nr:metal ABC transporter permease [Alphaproteobacteria bacterium]